MRDVRDILEQGVRGFDPGDGLDKTRRRVRRRQTTRRLVAAGTSLAVAAAGGVFAWRTFTDSAEVRPRPADRPSILVPGPTPEGQSCDPHSLEPSYTPDGFDADPRRGPGGGIPADAWPGDAVHYQGPNPGAHLTVTLLENLDAVPEPHPVSASDPERVSVASGDGTIGLVEDGASVEARIPGNAACDSLWIVAYGLDRRELRRFAEGLGGPPAAPSHEPCPSPAVRPTYLPEDFDLRPRQGPGPWDPQLQRTPESAIHFRGPEDGSPPIGPGLGTFIEVTLDAGPVSAVHEIYGQTRVLGVPAEFGESHFGYALAFRYGEGLCRNYGIVGSNVPLKQVRRFAEGLRPA